MTRGEALQAKVHFKGKDEDFLCFVDDIELYKKWQTDKSVPLAHFVSSFKVFVTHKQGAQGTYDGASNGALDNEFNTHKDDEVIKAILEKGSLQETQFAERTGERNESQGGRVAH